MSTVEERIYIEAPYTQAVGAFERRLGIEPGQSSGTCTLTLVAPAAQGQTLARVVNATAERLADSANYQTKYKITWEAGQTSRGIPTPGFTGVLTLGAGEDYSECELRLKGEYVPPGGTLGSVFDGLVGARIAHATLGALLDEVGRDLRKEHVRMEASKQGP